MCRISGCSSPAVAQGLCAKHYMRQRRTGDPTITRKPGVNPDAWRNKIAALERELAQARAEPKGQPAPEAASGKTSELRRQLAQAKAEIKELKGALKSAAVQRRRQLSGAPKAPVFIAKGSAAKIRMALDPDRQQDPARKKLHTQALQIFETLPLREIET